MAFGGFDNKTNGAQSTVSEINMVPLIDVMLVLLVIFIITAPLLAHSIKIDLPQVSHQPVNEDIKAVDIAITHEGKIFVNNTALSLDELREFFINSAKLNPNTDYRIRAHVDTRYEIIAQVMGAAKGSQVKRLGFITTPAPSSP